MICFISLKIDTVLISEILFWDNLIEFDRKIHPSELCLASRSLTMLFGFQRKKATQ